jgi:hypothetical protein
MCLFEVLLGTFARCHMNDGHPQVNPYDSRHWSPSCQILLNLFVRPSFSLPTRLRRMVARNLLCLANAEYGALRRHNFWLIAFLFFALLAKLRN